MSGPRLSALVCSPQLISFCRSGRGGATAGPDVGGDLTQRREVLFTRRLKKALSCPCVAFFTHTTVDVAAGLWREAQLARNPDSPSGI